WIAMAVVLLLGNVAVRRQYPQLAQLANPQVIQAQQLANARRAMLQHRTDDAIAQLQEIIQQQPKEAEPRYLLGEAYLYQHKPDDAIAAFREALRLKPDYAEAEAALGSAYLDKGMKPEAEQAFKKAAELGYTGD
ncbi:MAG TPA: tetratricopeptide repeat protein, partial [Terriglobales bacterium]